MKILRMSLDNVKSLSIWKMKKCFKLYGSQTVKLKKLADSI